MDSRMIIYSKFKEIIDYYNIVFPPFGIPEKNTNVYDYRQELILSYSDYLIDYNDSIILKLFDEYDAAMSLLILQSMPPK